MSRSALTLKALRERIVRLPRGWQNRIWAHRARLGGRPEVAGALPEPIFLGDSERGQALLDGRWRALGREVQVGAGSIWGVPLPDARLEAERQACLWLDDLAALGNRQARVLAQAWVQDWIHRFGAGSGPGWEAEAAGRRAKRWSVHAALLTQGLDKGAVDRFWRALAGAPALPDAGVAAGGGGAAAAAGAGRAGLGRGGAAAPGARGGAGRDGRAGRRAGRPRRGHAVAGAGGPGGGADPAHLDGAAAGGQRPARHGAAPAGDRARGAGGAAAAHGRRRGGAVPWRRGRARPSGWTRRWPSCGWWRSRSRGSPWVSRGWPAGGWWC